MNLAALTQQYPHAPIDTVEFFWSAVTPLTYSLILGGVLMLMTLWSGSVSSRLPSSGPKAEASMNFHELILNSANVMFLCFGVTAVMILVNNDLARAFAIGAAIALVRFRIKMNEGTGGSLFFAVVAGMACGVGQMLIGALLVAVFVALQGLVLVAAQVASRRSKPVPVSPILTAAGTPAVQITRDPSASANSGLIA